MHFPVFGLHTPRLLQLTLAHKLGGSVHGNDVDVDVDVVDDDGAVVYPAKH
jgi:hypothetical protein